MATDPSCLRAIQTVASVLAGRGILYAVIGGTAIQLIYGVASTRPTADVDAVILVRDLEEFLQVQADLGHRGWTQRMNKVRTKLREHKGFKGTLGTYRHLTQSEMSSSPGIRPPQIPLQIDAEICPDADAVAP